MPSWDGSNRLEVEPGVAEITAGGKVNEGDGLAVLRGSSSRRQDISSKGRKKTNAMSLFIRMALKGLMYSTPEPLAAFHSDRVPEKHPMDGPGKNAMLLPGLPGVLYDPDYGRT